MRGKSIPAFTLLVCLVAAGSARADEIRLKDGTKIVGTIVGFENDSFRVETSFGFALIQKDKVADISIVAAKKESEPKPKTTTPAPPALPAGPGIVPAVAQEPASSASDLADANAIAPMHVPIGSCSPSAAAEADTY